MPRKNKRTTDNHIPNNMSKFKAVKDKLPNDLESIWQEIKHKNDKEVMQYGK